MNPCFLAPTHTFKPFWILKTFLDSFKRFFCFPFFPFKFFYIDEVCEPTEPKILEK